MPLVYDTQRRSGNENQYAFSQGTLHAVACHHLADLSDTSHEDRRWQVLVKALQLPQSAEAYELVK